MNESKGLDLSNLILNGGAVAILGWLVIVGIPKLTDKIEANTAVLTELRHDMQDAREWQRRNDPGANRKVLESRGGE